MLKLLGAVFIVVATTWTGFEMAKIYTERPRQIRQLRAALQSLEAEIMYGHTPLHTASQQIAKQLAQPVSTLFPHSVISWTREVIPRKRRGSKA